ncbi:hypothetical protein [Nocardia sp. NPDC051570]|uniref:hypothetical protein n=1 Tax=Nocardia sp. NPDC051570 TaxID=3364324 RepID=UPI00379604E6
MPEKLGNAALLFGAIAAVPSIWQTIGHITDETYRVAGDRLGERHAQYHMAREALITLGAFGTIATGAAAGSARSPQLWRAMAWAAGGFAAALWSGGPAIGEWSPNRGALISHIASTAGLGIGVALLRPRRG